MNDPLTDTTFPEYDEREARPTVSATIERALEWLMYSPTAPFSQSELTTALDFVREFGVE